MSGWTDWDYFGFGFAFMVVATIFLIILGFFA